MKKIKLINSTQEAIVDDEDYEFINQFEWYLTTDHHAGTMINGQEVLMEEMVLARAEEKKKE